MLIIWRSSQVKRRKVLYFVRAERFFCVTLEKKSMD